VIAGQVNAASGTSVAAPAFAGLVLQLNAALRATKGLENATLGYMNPFLYWAASNYRGAFYDVTDGGNNFGEGNATVCATGYIAARGWDAATGLGVPRVGVLARAAVRYAKLQRGLA
jgi:tripeptidyl-peptidase-1